MPKQLLCWFLLLLLLPGLGMAQAQRAVRPVPPPQLLPLSEPDIRYRALLIGNNEYEHENWENLKTAINDVERLAEVLQTSYGFAPEDVILLRNATRREILQAFRQLRQAAQPEDRVLVYYAGHGYADSETNRGFWVPIDAADEIDYLPNEVIRKEMEIIGAKHKLLIADSCFSGTFATQIRSLGKQDFDWRERGFYVNLSSDPSFQAITSGGNEPVFDGGPAWGNHSVFAFHLLSKLRNNRDPYLPVRRLGDHLSEQVANDVASILRKRQQPNVWQIRPGHAGGEFFFLRQDTLGRQVAFAPSQPPPPVGYTAEERLAELNQLFSTPNGPTPDAVSAFRQFEEDYSLATLEQATNLSALTQRNLGILYREGRGVSANDTKAVFWLERGASQGDPVAMTRLGFLHFYGKGTQQDYGKALEWYRRAANRGHGPAQFNLASMYRKGQGTSANEEEAIKWYRKAANNGMRSQSQKILAWMGAN